VEEIYISPTSRSDAVFPSLLPLFPPLRLRFSRSVLFSPLPPVLRFARCALAFWQLYRSCDHTTTTINTCDNDEFEAIANKRSPAHDYEHEIGGCSCCTSDDPGIRKNSCKSQLGDRCLVTSEHGAQHASISQYPVIVICHKKLSPIRWHTVELE
jgi:hypothetical protein